MPITINLDGVEAWKGAQMLPPGRHLCRCIDAEEGRSSGGHFELHLTWEAITGEHTGGQLQDWVQVTQSALGKIRQLLNATGADVPAGEFSLSAQMFRGRTAELVAREGRKPNGDVRMEVAAYNAPPKGSDLGTDQGREFTHSTTASPADAPPF
jgi:hypothetical protein